MAKIKCDIVIRNLCGHIAGSIEGIDSLKIAKEMADNMAKKEKQHDMLFSVIRLDTGKVVYNVESGKVNQIR